LLHPADPTALPLFGGGGVVAPPRPQLHATLATAAKPAVGGEWRVDDEPRAAWDATSATRRAAVAIGLACLAIVAVVGGSRLLGHRGSVDAVATPAQAATVSTDATPSCAVVTDVHAIAADVNGDGCPDEVHVADGVVSTGSARWAVGEPDDDLFVGDWDCDGLATVAVVRADTGEVFVFDGWSETGADLVATPVPGIDDAVRGAAVDRDGDGCPELVVDRASGSEVEVRA
jgi:hypothetical protein